MTTTLDLQTLSARDCMRSEIHWTTPDELLLDAARRMHACGVRALLVRRTGARDPLPGIVTSKDVVNLLGSHAAAVLAQVQVGDVSTGPAVCVPAHASLAECIHLMRLVGVRRMPVLDGIEVVGVLSTSDIFERVAAG